MRIIQTGFATVQQDNQIVRTAATGQLWINVNEKGNAEFNQSTDQVEEVVIVNKKEFEDFLSLMEAFSTQVKETLG